ncbi:hypothetical protein GW17_00060037, partial [Ensete ventricosum]
QQGGGAASHDQPPCRAGHPRRGPLQGGSWLQPRLARKGDQRAQPLVVRRPQRGRLQGARKGLLPAASLVINRGDDASHRGGCPLAGWLPTGKGSRRLRRGSGGDDDADGERGVRASFGEKDDLAALNFKNFEDCACDSGTNDAVVRDHDA